MSNDAYILITGASSGIGREIAINLSASNRLILCGRHENRLDEVIRQCSNQGDHTKWIFDLNNVDELEVSLSALILLNKLPVCGFIHSAGYIKLLPLKSITVKQLEETMNVNFNSAVLISKSLISNRLNSKNLRNVIFISSISSMLGAKGLNIYSASKGALNSLMRSMAVELAPNVRVNSVLPGSVETPMTQEIYSNENFYAEMIKHYPLGPGSTIDVFNIVDFLLSPQSKWITGQQFTIDGGRSINIST